MKKDMTLPEISENTDAGTVVAVRVSTGDTIAIDDPVIELETDKATVDVPADVAGEVREILVEVGDEVSVGQAILKIETGEESDHESESGSEPEPEGSAARQSTEASSTTQAAAGVPAAPSTRRLARELGADITKVRGTGPGGRISKDDVKAFADDRPGEHGSDGRSGGSALPDFSKWGSIRREPMNRIRTLTAKNTQRAWQTVPHVTQFDEADISALEEFRSEYAEVAKAKETKLTVTAILVKIVAEALRRFPRFNASLDEEAQEVVIKEFVNIGVAVDTDRGLMVPVIRDADTLSLIETATRLSDAAAAVREGTAKPDDLQGGTFTISNLGGIGGTAFTPVVFHPQVAILGISRTRTAPVWRGGAFEPRLILPVTLSYDHRVIDGADGARFLTWIRRALERPMFMHLENPILKGDNHE